jgi:hypothetical protein
MISVLATVVAAFFYGCGDGFRHIAGEERDDYDPGETGEISVRIGSITKPVDTEWRYLVTESCGATYETQVTVIALTENSYKLRERRKGHPDMEYYYEFGPEENGFTMISLYEEYEVGGNRVTYRYSPPKKYLPANGILRAGLSWCDGGTSVEETTMGHHKRHIRYYRLPIVFYSVEEVGSVKTPAREFVAATLITKTPTGSVRKKEYIRHFGTIKEETYGESGSLKRTVEILGFRFPTKDRQR